MISESQQEQAALFALNLLDADEVRGFELELAVNAELRGLLRALRDTAASLSLAEEMHLPPAALRNRVLAAVVPGPSMAFPVRPAVRPAAPEGTWLPWAVAALFMASTGVLGWFYTQQHARYNELAQQNLAATRELPAPAPPDDLARLSFCALEPTLDFTTAQPRAAVLWDAVHHEGRLRVNRLAPPAVGKDYQLWTVETGRKDPVSAGVVHVNADGQADLPFKPVDQDGKPVAAVAISLEQAGGSSTNRGPILLLGKF